MSLVPPRRSLRALLVSDEYIQTNHPRLKQVKASSPVVSPVGRHAKRRISAVSTTPGGGTHIQHDEVCYTYPVKSEHGSPVQRRNARHRTRETSARLRLDRFAAWEPVADALRCNQILHYKLLAGYSHCSLLTAYCSLLTAHCLLLTTHCPLLTTQISTGSG
jgi:hypothetical protein